MEIKSALLAMKKHASPGSDGITVPFYEVFWPLIGDMVFASLQYAWSQGSMSISQRRGLIRLLPKANKNLFQVGNWRPITLLNVDFKILTKSLALRLSAVLPNIIHQDQKGFVKNRYSGENVLDVYAMIQQASTDTDEEYALLMLDIEKAFDSVSLCFLEEVMFAFNFPPSFITWVRILYAGKELRVVNNGYSSDPIYPTRGCAQGCSLSPLLYVLVMEALALSIRANSNIAGFSVNNHHKKIAMLADDTLLGLKANKLSFESALTTLKEFAIISNLKVNETKSVVIPLGIQPATRKKLQGLSNFKWLEGDSFKYVGIDVYTNPLEQTYSQAFLLLPDVIRILKERDKVSTTILGRVVILKSLVSSWLLYPLSLAPSPSPQEFRSLQAPCTDYVWANGLHPVKLETLCQDFTHGGCNMYSVRKQDQALKLAWLVRLLSPTQQFWKTHLFNQFKVPLLQALNFNIKFNRWNRLLKSQESLHPFWTSVFRTWCEFHYTAHPYRDALVAYNSALRSASVFHPRVVRNLDGFAIETNNDFAEIVPMLNMKQKRTIHYGTLIRMVPPEWIQDCQTPKPGNVTSLILESPLSTGAISQQITKEVSQFPTKIWDKWNADLDTMLVGIKWLEICNKMKYFMAVKLKSFYFKYINRLYVTNFKLKLYKRLDNDLCTFCKQATETRMHLYWDCPIINVGMGRCYRIL